ncbi:MAG: hypothetical protein UR96_C0044G0004 [candidate division WS6 bacterium GW2011_GWC1_36_11]|uniref:Uncharacterized protein n=2 Tax=Candidatus Dojkabacteria TaxID=74243 RepID=A0A0G0GFH5_9BACT|nr:MAG: hypothetical protein UR96_C0044G0004 [candidate division WS6 bacterium GW2011_GWC1_36_11]KKQ10772.1 MAG: hypothetical protein US24_C0057G0005 [candidate division WS6 bacterium GW2011_GWC2_36_7]
MDENTRNMAEAFSTLAKIPGFVDESLGRELKRRLKSFLEQFGFEEILEIRSKAEYLTMFERTAREVMLQKASTTKEYFLAIMLLTSSGSIEEKALVSRLNNLKSLPLLRKELLGLRESETNKDYDIARFVSLFPKIFRSK